MLDDKPDQLSKRPFIAVSILVLLIWLVASWFITHAYISWKTDEASAVIEKKARIAIGELYEGIYRAMNFLHAIPYIIGQDKDIQQTLREINRHPELAKIPRERLAAHLHQIPSLAGANKKLENIAKNIDIVSIFWLMRKDGTAIAASNADTPESFVGTNYSDRDYFKTAIRGENGQQYAMGRRTNVPGLFFSVPIWGDNEIIGVTAGKVNLSYLYSWIGQTNSFLIDEYGIIIQATDPKYELMAMPESGVYKLSEEDRQARYMKTQFEKLEFSPWKNGSDTATYYRVGNNNQPYYMLSTELEGHNLKLMVAIENPAIKEKAEKHWMLFLTSAAGGSFLILLFATLIYHFKSLNLLRETQAKQELIHHLASYDSLTGLYSRSLTDQLITQSIAIASKNSTLSAVMFIDVDLFKDINDSFGHEIGDQILLELAGRIKAVVGTTDVIIRQGGDEFIILLNDINDPGDVANVAVNLQSSIKKPFLIQQTSITLSASIGIAIYPNDGETASLLLRRAETALHNVKKKGRADYTFYQTKMSVDLAARKALEMDMMRALENNEFFLVYQPKYSHFLDSIAGCEALIRWQHPTGRIIPPAEFIPIAEYSGFINKLGEWILNEACRQATEWRETLGDEIAISINLSSVQFQRSDLLDIVRSAITQHKITPGNIEFEVTESILMADTELTLNIIQGMKSLGISISIDDFGTGYSSLAYLKKFDADILKIDSSFVCDMENDANDRAIINAVINMSRDLDYQVIAEGVETKKQYDLLIGMGCYTIQGYWFSKPLTPEAFFHFYMEHKTKTMQEII